MKHGMTTAVLILLLCPVTIYADVVHLANGGKIEGEVKDLGDHVQVKTRFGLMEFTAEEVRRIEKKALPWEDYPRRRAELDKQDKKDGAVDHLLHMDLARWCILNGLKTEAAQELILAIEEPALAEEAGPMLQELGYVRHEGKWMTYKEAMEKKGYLYRNGHWYTANEIKTVDQEKSVHQLIKKYGQAKPPDREGIRQQILASPAFLLLRPMMDGLKDSNREVRKLAIDYFRSVKAAQLVPHLVKTSLEDSDEGVRKTALETVKELDTKQAVPWYGYVCVNDQGQQRMRAVAALQFLDNEEAVPYLINALWPVLMEIRATTARLTPGPPAMRTVGTALGPVEVPQLEIVRIRTTLAVPAGFQAQSIAHALEEISGAGFGEDYGQWITWYNNKYGTGK